MAAEIEVARALARCEQLIMASGREVAQTSDFEDVVPEILESSKGRINLESSPEASDLTGESATYLTVRGESGTLEGFVSIRLILIGEERLRGHLVRQYRRIYGNGTEAISPDDLPPVANEVRGRVAFISDVFIERSSRGPNRLDPSLMIVLAYAVARLRWRPEWIFGFAKDRDVRRGLAARYMATRLYPSAVRWLVETPNRRDDDWLLLLSSAELDYVLQRAPDLLSVSGSRSRVKSS